MVGQVFDFKVVSTWPTTKSLPEHTKNIEIYAEKSTKEDPEKSTKENPEADSETVKQLKEQLAKRNLQQEEKVQEVFGFKVGPSVTSSKLFVIGEVTTLPVEATKHGVMLEKGTAQRLNHGI